MQTNKAYAALVLRNPKLSVASVNYTAVVDALLSGGVIIEELEMLSYEKPSAVLTALSRLSEGHDGVILICDKVLLKTARDGISAVVKKPCTGTLTETKDCLFAVLPAGEMGAEIAKAEVIPAVDLRRSESYSSIVIKTVSAPSEVMLASIADAKTYANDKMRIQFTEQHGIGRIELVYNQLTPKMVADGVLQILATQLQEYIYAMEDVSLAQRLFDVLTLHKLVLSTAESFTGGGVAGAIVAIPGASEVFFEGINAYDNLAKIRRLGVSEYTLKSKGAVSHEVAYEMAAGLIREGNCNVAIATTGIAGPTSDDSKKPVGLCYIAIASKERVRVFEYHLEGSREEITKTATNLALFLAYKELS